MSRIAKAPVLLPKGVEATITGTAVSIKGGKGTLNIELSDQVQIVNDNGILKLSPKNNSQAANAMAGTTRAIVQNMVKGVSQGFERKLELVGVGYRAKAQGKAVNLVLGFSHPIDYQLPEGVTAETPTQTEIVLKGADKQVLGQVAAELRAFRAPEPYKGKGILHTTEKITLKEGKKV